MRTVNFREEVFRGTLLELLEQGRLEVANSQRTFPSAHLWLRQQLSHANNILPVRASALHRLRGSLHSVGDCGSSFMPVDNEPLADLYRLWIEGCEIKGSIGQALVEGNVVASWLCDQVPPPVPTMRFRGVKTPFRDRGLKLAHIADAARDFGTGSPLAEQIIIRFLRSLSPFNVFLFPSGRCCEFRLVSSSTGWQPKRADWAEDPELRQIALAWLIEWQGAPALRALPDFQSEMRPSPGWLRAAQGAVVEVRPRGSVSLIMKTKPTTKTMPLPTPQIRSGQTDSHACPRVPKSRAVTVSEAVEILRSWRILHPLATRIDGRKSGSNPDHWLHIRVDGYDDRKPFTSRFGLTFQGQDYNGVVNFHGDTTVVAVDHFIELIDLATDYRDVLNPSATYETKTKPRDSPVKPKFALQGYQDEVEGFFLYHDER